MALQLLGGNRRAASASARGPWPCSLGSSRWADERQSLRYHSTQMRILFEDGTCEDIDTEPVRGRYRLLATPLCSSSDLRLGDVVELTSEGDIWRFQRVMARSPLVTVEYLVTRKIAELPAFHSLLEKVRQSGGEWERAFGGVVFIHLPPTSVPWIKSQMANLLEENE